jgi:hypothetical protein
LLCERLERELGDRALRPIARAVSARSVSAATTNRAVLAYS